MTADASPGGGDAGTWVDLHAPGPEQLEGLRRRFGIASERLPPPGRTPRPGLLEEEGYAVVTLVGAVDSGRDDRLGEVHCVIAPSWLVTIHHEPCAALGAVAAGTRGPAAALEAVARALVTSLVELARDLDIEVEAIEDGRERDVTPTRRRVVALRRVVLPQRDVLGRLGQQEAIGPGWAGGQHAARGLRNAAERMAQVGAEAEALREALHDCATDRQNEVVARLTLVAAVFLPLTFLTGFFGQNFPWLVEGIGGAWWFVALGLVLPVVVVAALLLWMGRRGWITAPRDDAAPSRRRRGLPVRE